MSDRAAKELLRPDEDFLLVLRPDRVTAKPADLHAWLAANRDWLGRQLISHGAVLFRGFGLTPEQFRGAADAICPTDMPYLNGATPREKFGDGLYLASSFPPTLTLAQHHEMSYMPEYPGKVLFYCDIPAREGGETPVCSTRTFMRKLDPLLLEKFAKKGVRYLRNYDEKFTAHWKRAFLTEDRAAVERVCADSGLEAEWLPGDRLRTWGHGRAVVEHPVTGETLWHNHAVNFTLRSDSPTYPTPALRQVAPGFAPELVRALETARAEDLPTNVTYGDGKPIEREALEHVSAVLEGEKVPFTWQKGDFILVDNLLAFHGRNPFAGERRILTLLKDPILKQDQRRKAA